MDINDQMDEENNSLSQIIPFRSPAYSKDEVKFLVNLVEKYKHIILNKSTNTTTNHAKEAAWARISKEINKQGFKHKRNVDSLKTKWENLKKVARKATKNVIHLTHVEDDVICQIVTMIIENEKNSSINEVPTNWLEDINDDDSNPSKPWDYNDVKQSDNSSEDDDDKKLMLNRSLSFTPQECSLLLKCIRDEKKDIFRKETTSKAIKLKNSAWTRVSHTFNKLSSQKRTTRVLRTKFNNMKRMAKNVNFKNFSMKNKHEKLEEDTNVKLKTEPRFEYTDDLESDNIDEDKTDDDFHDIQGISNEHCDELPDPLSTVLKGDSGIDSFSHYGCCSQFENKEIIKLKLELLQYQLETAKFERQRIAQVAQAESEERESRAIETSLRMRAARLAVVAVEQQLPAGHAALRYEEPETRAQQYLQKFAHN